MRLNVTCRGLPDPDAVRDHARRRLGFALGRFAARIAAADVTVADENGPKGGPAIRCGIVVRGDRGWEVRASGDAAEPVAAVDLAARRVSGGVARALERRRDPAAGPRAGP